MERALRILNLEDNPNDAELIQARLEEEGILCELVRVETERDFVSAIERGGHDLLLVDYKLPAFDGMSALAIAKKKCPDVPFVFVSGSIGEDVAIEALKNGATDYVLKDKLSRLAPAVRRALQDAAARRKLRKAEGRLKLLNECFLKFGPDPLENINRLVSLCGEFMEGTCALYNRLEDERLCSWAQWNVPPDYNPVDAPEGHICYDVIRGNSDEVVVIRNLPETAYARTDPNVARYKLLTYVGIAVKSPSAYVGSLCVVYQRDVVPSEDDKSIMGIIASAIGVEEGRNQAELEVAATAKGWQKTFDAIPSSVFLLDAEGRITRCNKATELLLGKTQEKIIGRPCWGLMHGTDKPIPECPMPSMKKDHERKSVVMPAEDRWIQVTVDPILDEAGEVTGAVHTIDDVTERKRAKDALQEVSEFNRQVIASAQEGIIVYGLDLKYLSWNSYMERLTGLPAANVLGKHPLEVFPFLREAGIMAGIDKALAGEVSEAARFQFNVPQTGRSGWASEISAPLRNAKGEIIGVIATVRDITEHLTLEDQLRHAQKMEAVGTLAGGIAHDFNNILNVIMGYGAMVMDKLESGSPLKEQMNEVLTAAERAANLTKRLLVFSRKQVVEVKPVNINELISGLQKMLVRIIRENIDFQLDLVDRPLTVLADAGQLEQVLMNLASNAKDAMPEGGRLTVGTEIKELDDEYVAAYGYGKTGRYALITVADTGQGMDGETQKKIFEPFFTTKGIGEGTGLGLAISYGIIKKHDGYIKVYSEPGQGTSFKIYLPLIEEQATLKKKIEAAAPAKGGTETVLVAEDDASLRLLSRIILESFGYSVITAEDGEDAIAKFMENREKINLVMLDMIMPKKNGKEACEAIRKASPKTKILFASGYTMDIVMTRELTEGGFDFILKPVRPKDLLSKVREILDR